MNGMSTILKILCRVIARRMEEGEELPHILRDYPKLTQEVTETILQELPSSIGKMRLFGFTAN